MAVKIPDWYLERDPCPVCEQVHRRCGDHVQRDGVKVPCGGAVAAGQWRCTTRHATATEKADIIDVEQMVKAFKPIGELLRKCSVTVRGRTYVESLEDALHRANTMVMLLYMLIETLPAASNAHASVVAEDTPREDIRWVTDEAGMVGPNHEGDLGVHPYVGLYKEWVQTQGQLSQIAEKLGLTERQIQVQEAHVRIMAATISGILSDLGIDIGDPRTRTIIETRLLAMETTAVEAPNALTGAATAS